MIDDIKNRLEFKPNVRYKKLQMILKFDRKPKLKHFVLELTHALQHLMSSNKKKNEKF